MSLFFQMLKNYHYIEAINNTTLNYIQYQASPRRAIDTLPLLLN